MDTTTLPAVQRPRDYGRATTALDQLLKETASLPQELRVWDRVCLVNPGMASTSDKADADHPSRNWSLVWSLKDIYNLSPSSIQIHHLTLLDEGEIKFLENLEDIHFNDSQHGSDRCYIGTDQTSFMPGSYRTELVGSIMPPEQSVPFTTEPMERTRRPKLDSLASMGADLARPEGHRTLLRHLQELEQRPESERWPAAEWPSDKAFKDARTFIYALPMSSIPLPHLSFADDGEINFYWGQNGIHIDLGFYGTGTYSYYACGRDEEGFYDDDVPISSGLPGAVLALLSS